MKPELRPGLAARAAVVGLSFAFRAPELVHAREVNSDSAIVGLQAMHLAQGELSAFLWGSGYQSAADAYWAVPFFGVLGPTPFALVLSALSLHVIATLALLSLGERHARLARIENPAFAGALLSLPLVFTTAAVHTYALFPPRQLAITLALVGLALVDGAGARARPHLHLALGGGLSALACAADPYALSFAPLAGLLVVLAALDGPGGGSRVTFEKRALAGVARRLGAGGAGALAGALALVALWRSDRAKLGVTSLDTSRFERNLKLFTTECGPWAFGSKSYYARHMMDYAPWEPPRAYTLFATGAACLFLALFPAALLLALTARNLPYATRRAGVVGALALPLGLAGFLTSVMVMDHFSMRYLASVPLLLPLALTPLLGTLGPRRLAAVLAPVLVASGVSGWVSFGPDVRGPFIAPRAPGATDEERAQVYLKERGVTYAMADYWTAYRVSFVTAERLIVVPRHAAQDRYAPHRRAFAEQRRVAYLVDPLRTGESPDGVAEELARGALLAPATQTTRVT
ncbi:MAG TPA: hypothetical protein PK141_22115, partial [Polyangiaceae bacterium]|nr:hypothetical protein [Polyangiaceae bacterium]